MLLDYMDKIIIAFPSPFRSFIILIVVTQIGCFIGCIYIFFIIEIVSRTLNNQFKCNNTRHSHDSLERINIAEVRTLVI